MTDPTGAKTGRLGRVHDRLLDALMLVKDGAPVDRALDQVFRRSRDLGSSERREIADDLYALSRARRRIEDLLERGAKAEGKRIELIEAPLRARLEILTFYADRGMDLAALEATDAYAFRRVPGLFARVVAGKVPEPKRRTAAERVGVERSLPDWLATRLVASFGEERADSLGAALLGRAPLTLRVNTLMGSREEIRRRILLEHGVDAAPTPLSPWGLILPEHVAIQSWKIFEEGAIEVQDEGSQLIALATGAKPGQVVLDACAGAGGKTLALGAMMGNGGRLIALDRDEPKLAELRRRARRAGLTNHEPITTDFVSFPPELSGKADVVLVDAPCTGSGAFRRSPDARWRTGVAELAKDTGRQLSLLIRAVDATRPGGRILYATCSLLVEENESIVQAAIAKQPKLGPVPLEQTLGPELAARLGASHEVRVGPGPGPRDPDGFYFALLERRP